MGLSGKFDSSFLATTQFTVKFKRPLMDSGASWTAATTTTTTTTTTMGGRRREKLSATNEITTTRTTISSSSTATITTGLKNNNVLVGTVPPNTQEVAHRILGERTKWQDNDALKGTRYASYGGIGCRSDIVPSIETPTSDALKKRTSIVNGRVLATQERKLPKDIVGRENISKLKNSRELQREVVKSGSVASNLKEGLPARERALRQRIPEEGILKKSSAFLASLTHSKFSERKISGIVESSRSNEYLPNCPSNYSRYLKGYFTISNDDKLHPLLRSSSVQTLPTSWKKKQKKKNGVTVKKSVSFSSDTSFEEKRAPYRRVSAVHDSKVYRKGVLQDRCAGEEIKTKVPPSWRTPSGGPSALLRAARESDDAVLKEIVARAREFGLGDMEVNLADSSGRTAISYMAGNGAATMLEAALSIEGVDPNIPDNEGNTPLHFAAQAGQTECLNTLLQRCPDIEVDARNTLGFTPLMKAALQGRTKCAKILLFAGANPTLRDHGRGLRAEQWARFCGRYVCAEMIERFARHRLLERTTSCRWGSEPELAVKVLQGKVMPIPTTPMPPPSSGFKSKIRKVFRTSSGPDRSFSLVTQLTSAALCASSPALPKPGDVPPVVKSLLRPLSVPQLRVTLVSPQDFLEKTSEKYGTNNFAERIEGTAIVKPPRSKKKNK